MGHGERILDLHSAAEAPHTPTRMEHHLRSPSKVRECPANLNFLSIFIFQFTHIGSAIYVLGDKKNDHGIYSVVLDEQPEVFLNDISGCGGAFGMTCEQQAPTLKFLASNLNDSRHTLKLTNHAGVNDSFFGNIFISV